jgi:signal transduction histidine kinase
MKEEIGKWLMDIAKYVATAIVITGIFSDVTDIRAIVTLGVIICLPVLVIGLYLIKQAKEKDINNINKKKKGKKR